MRLKILAVLSGIILVMGLTISALLVMNLQDAGARERDLSEQAERAVHSAGLQWAADAREREAWLALQSEQSWVQEVFRLATGSARAEAATAAANRLIELSRNRGALAGPECTFAVFVDTEGVGIGRNSGPLMRGELLSAHLAGLWERAAKEQAASGIWFSLERQEQLFVSLVPVVGPQGPAGSILLGTPISDEALARASGLTLGAPLVAAALRGNSLVLVAKSRSGPEQELVADATQWAQLALRDSAAQVHANGGQALGVLRSAIVHGSVPRDGQGSGTQAFPVAVAGFANAETGLVLLGLGLAPASTPTGKLLWGVWAVVALGLLAAGVASFLLGAYFSGPIAELEDGLLQVIGGDEELRFDLEHAELGPLVSRINTLLDSFAGGRLQEQQAESGSEPRGESDVQDPR